MMKQVMCIVSSVRYKKGIGSSMIFDAKQIVIMTERQVSGSMMKIDEAIAKYKEITNTDANCPAHCNISCDKCIQESEQLTEWLEELKDYRDKNKMVVRVDVENMDNIKDKIEELSKYAESQYNKAIDDFVRFANTMPTVESEDGTIRPMWLEEIAEQLKVGVTND